MLDAAEELRVAEEILRDAEDLAVAKPRIAAREAYLAMFHAAQARIAAAGRDVPKTHKGVSVVIAELFQGDAYHAQSILSDAENWKFVADYGRGKSLSVGEVAEAIEAAQIFVLRMRSEIAASGALERVAEPVDYDRVLERGLPGRADDGSQT